MASSLFNPDANVTIAKYYDGGPAQRFLPIRGKTSRETCKENFEPGPAIYATLRDRWSPNSFGFFWRHTEEDPYVHDILAEYTPATKAWDVSLQLTPVEVALFAYYLLNGIPVMGTLNFREEGAEIGHVIAWLMQPNWGEANTLNVQISLFETYYTNPGKDGWVEPIKAIPQAVIAMLFKHRTGGFLVDGEASRVIPKAVADAWGAGKPLPTIAAKAIRYFPRNDQNLQAGEAGDMGRCIRWAYIFMDYLTSLKSLDGKPIPLSEATPEHFKFIVGELAMLVTTPKTYAELIDTRGMNRRGGRRRRRTRRRPHKRLGTLKHFRANKK